MAPSSLRIVHTGCAGLRLELGAGQTFAVDPASDPGPVQAIVVTWNEAERLRGALEAARSGRLPRVAAEPAILAWLARGGGVEACDLDRLLPGVQVEAEPYTPIPYATPMEALRKTRSGLVSPLRAARRLGTRARLPSAPPLVLRLTLPDGRVLVHLNCALHRGTPQGWLLDLSERWAGADWVLASWDYGEGEAFCERIPSLSPKQLIITDLVGEVRQRLGLPVDLRSLVADRLTDRGLSVLMLAARTSLRFE
jgi:hypothetical protein